MYDNAGFKSYFTDLEIFIDEFYHHFLLAVLLVLKLMTATVPINKINDH